MLISAKNVSKSRIFKNRPVTIKLQLAEADATPLITSGGLPDKPENWDGDYYTLDSVDLTEVSSIKEQVSGGVGQSKGVITAVLQMWYLSPVTITITGRSYMGAFNNDNTVGIDSDADSLLTFRDAINSYFYQTGTASNMRFKLIYGAVSNLTSANRPASLQSFVGFIDDISIDESEDRPYMRDYSVRFIGEDETRTSVIEGARQCATDLSSHKAVKAEGVTQPGTTA